MNTEQMFVGKRYRIYTKSHGYIGVGRYDGDNLAGNHIFDMRPVMTTRLVVMADNLEQAQIVHPFSKGGETNCPTPEPNATKNSRSSASNAKTGPRNKTNRRGKSSGA